MRLLCLDFETFYSKDFTLSKYTTEAYVRDEQFETILVGLRWADEPKGAWYPRDQIPEVFDAIDWKKTGVLAHHAHFDGLILNHHYGWKPKFWFDTLSMGRYVHGNALRNSLAKLAEHYGLGTKAIDYDSFIGKRIDDVTPFELHGLGCGCLGDVDLTLKLFGVMMARGQAGTGRRFDPKLLRLIDMTVRLFTQPQIEADAAYFDNLANEEDATKNQLADELEVGMDVLKSSKKFAELLEGMGIDVATKPGKNGPIPALAKNDWFMYELTQRGDGIADLAEARIRCSSSIDESRSRRLARMAERGKMCVYLNFAAAHTYRWGGGDKTNLQNLRRNSAIRKGFKAPPGKIFLNVDSSQGECRLANYHGGDYWVTDMFAKGEDLYSATASEAYGYTVTKAMKEERGLGKLLELSCGYGSGARTAQSTARAGQYGPKVVREIGFFAAAVRTYRGLHTGIVKSWKEGDNVLTRMGTCQDDEVFTWAPGVDGHETGQGWFRYGRGWLESPDGSRMYYKLRWFKGDGDKRSRWYRHTRDGLVPIWGGTLIENVIQHIHWVFVGDVINDLLKEGLNVVWTTHDDVTLLIDDDDRKDAIAEHVRQRMARSADWAPGLVMDGEAVLSHEYK